MSKEQQKYHERKGGIAEKKYDDFGFKVTEDEQAQKLFKERKFRTVPQIFDDKGKHIGGFHDLRSTIHWPDNPVECGKIG